MTHTQSLKVLQQAPLRGGPRGAQAPAKYTNLHTSKTVQQLRSELKGLIYFINLNDTPEGYVGSTVQPELRFYSHFVSGLSSNLHLQNAFNKYGKENFTLYILEF